MTTKRLVGNVPRFAAVIKAVENLTKYSLLKKRVLSIVNHIIKQVCKPRGNEASRTASIDDTAIDEPASHGPKDIRRDMDG